jgi:hypothetical protein
MPLQFRLGKGLICFSFKDAVTKYTKLWVFMDALQGKSISERQLKPIETSRGSPIQIVTYAKIMGSCQRIYHY